MIITKKALARRTFLRGAGAVGPARLDAMIGHVTRPKRGTHALGLRVPPQRSDSRPVGAYDQRQEFSCSRPR